MGEGVMEGAKGNPGTPHMNLPHNNPLKLSRAPKNLAPVLGSLALQYNSGPLVQGLRLYVLPVICTLWPNVSARKCTVSYIIESFLFVIFSSLIVQLLSLDPCRALKSFFHLFLYSDLFLSLWNSTEFSPPTVFGWNDA